MVSQEWRRLAEDDFWIRCTFKEDSYSIWLTDLCQLYSEELDSEDFRRRATKAKLPIDVDEAHNLSTLLKNLSKSVINGELQVSLSANKSRYVDLNATVHLPKPLSDVQWTFMLEQQPDEKFRDKVSKPLLARIDGLGHREEDLIHRLHDKDHAIDKLLDTLEKYSVDLADVFPSLASHGTTRRSNTRRDAEAHIPALQAFDAKIWQDNIERGSRYEGTQPIEPLGQVLEKQSKDPTSELHQGGKKLDAVNGTTKGIKRTLGGRTTPIEAQKTAEPSQDEQPISASTTAKEQKPKGIKRVLGGRKPEKRIESETTEALSPESKPLSTEKPEGIKREPGDETIQSIGYSGMLSPSPKAPSARDERPEQPAHLGRDKTSEEAIDDDGAANEKRAALKRQFAAAAGTIHKPKKRKF